MKTETVQIAWLLCLSVVGSPAVAAAFSPIIARHGAVEQLVEAQWQRDRDGLVITVMGLAAGEVTGVSVPAPGFANTSAATLNVAAARIERQGDTSLTLRWEGTPDSSLVDANATLP